MSDLTGLTLTTTAPTTTAPALIAWSAHREAARAQREAWRLERFRRARELDQAAAQSLTRPAPAAPKPPKVPAFEVRPCSVDGCNTPTRGRHLTAQQLPGTRRRDSQGRCPDCAAKGGSPTGTKKPLPMQRIADDYRAGASLLELSNKYGAAKSTIRTRLIGEGVTIRPRGGNGRRGRQ